MSLHKIKNQGIDFTRLLIRVRILRGKLYIIRFAVLFAVCAALTCFPCYRALEPKGKTLAKKKAADTGRSVTESVADTGEKTQTEKTAESNAPDNVSSKSEAVAAMSSGKVLGKISEKFISPYTANTSYNNVYLKNSTDLSVDIKSLLSSPLSYKIVKNDSPQVLILHTHATESFMSEDKDYYSESDSSRTADSSKNMIKLGDIVSKKLNAAGIKTLHDTTLHDYPSYNDAYPRAYQTIKNYLNKYPDIKIVIDMHRDCVMPSSNEKVKLTTMVNGKKAAQIMLVMGSQSGSVKTFPNYKENLKLAVKIQQAVEVMYPGLARSISLASKIYNENLTTGSVLIEVGTDANTLEEVSYSAELLGNALAGLFNTFV